MDKKAILWPVVISVLIHVTFLGVAGMIDLRETIQPVDILAVSLSDPEPEPEEKPAAQKEQKPKEKPKPAENRRDKTSDVREDGWREDTVDLGSLDIKYVNYLGSLKTKLLRLWKYPRKSYERNEEGYTVIRMSIDADGRLAAIMLMSSSGYEELDAAALEVVQTAAPFEPLPEMYNLSRLNIVASFEYKIRE